MWRSLLSHLPRVSCAPANLLHPPSALLHPSCLHTSTASENMDLQVLVAVLEGIAPTSAAEPWDNVGLLVEPSRPSRIQRVLITNDLTEAVLEEALSSLGGKVGLVVSYHPPLFKPFKRLTQRCAKERIVVRALEEGVAVYSPHTSLDNMEGGINDWLLSVVGEGEVMALGVHKHCTPYPNLLELPVDMNQLEMFEKQAGVGEIRISKSAVVVECSDRALASLLPVLRRDHPALSVSVATNSKVMPTLCGGKLLALAQPVPLSKVVARVKEQLKLKHVRLARPSGVGEEEDPVIRSAAACAGSGGGVLEGGQADLLLTGEMSHHDVLEAVSRGSAVILCEHSNTERGFLQTKYKEMLEQTLNGVQVSIATADRDPLETV